MGKSIAAGGSADNLDARTGARTVVEGGGGPGALHGR